MSRTTSSVERLFMTSCLRSSKRMYTRSAFGLYRISIVDLPFPVKDVNGSGDYNISFDSEKDFDFFLLVISAKAGLAKLKNFALAQTPILCRYWTSAVDNVFYFFTSRASFGCALESMRIDPNVHCCG